MIFIETAAETGIIDLIIGIGGSLLVAIVSVATIILSNRNTRKLKLDDYRREELDTVAETVESARAAIEQMVTVHSLVRSLKGQEIASRQREKTQRQIKAELELFLELRRSMEKNLLRVSITNPHEFVRKSAVMVDDAVTIAYDQGLAHWKEHSESDRFHEVVNEQVDLAKDCFMTFRQSIYQIYHGEKYTNRAIRKSDILEKDKKVKAARKALDSSEASKRSKTDGKDQ